MYVFHQERQVTQLYTTLVLHSSASAAWVVELHWYSSAVAVGLIATGTALLIRLAVIAIRVQLC